MSRFLLTGVFIGLGGGALGPQLPLAARPEGGAVTVSLSALANGIRFCSRTAPAGMTGFWEVPAADVAGVDAALLKHLHDSGLEKGLVLAPTKYERQFLGFRRGNRRFIYVNAFASRFLRAVGDSRKEIPRICDGGSLSWGIEYDVKRASFAHFAPNY